MDRYGITVVHSDCDKINIHNEPRNNYRDPSWLWLYNFYADAQLLTIFFIISVRAQH